MPYKLTPEADHDLIEIYVYGFLNFGEPQAEQYFSELEDCFQRDAIYLPGTHRIYPTCSYSSS